MTGGGMSEREPSFLRREPGQPVAAGASAVPGGPAAAPDRQPLGPASRSRDAAPTFHAAGFWRRLGGGLVDLAVLAPVSLLLLWLASSLTGIQLPAARYRSLDFWLDLLLASDPALVGGGGLLIAIGLVYAVVFHLTTGRTPGMRVVGVRVIDLYGDPPSTGRGLARSAGYLAGLATVGLGFLWIAFDSEKRGLHDYLSGTYVVKG
jgi:uncharacterized RDD family membrane protein YckC